MRKLLLLGILVLAFLVRVPLLDKYPVGFTPDEASFGYDAYSILHTGRDQWGHILPLVLESFGDYKAPLYSYLDIPFVAFFGLNKFSTRLPNALLGIGAVLIVYLLVNELFLQEDKMVKNHGKVTIDHQLLAIIAAFLLAISPWHIMLSRGAFEANLTTFFLPLGVLLFIKGLKNSKFMSWSALILGLNLFTYHSAKVVTPLVFLTLIFWKTLVKIGGRKLILPIFIFCIFSLLTIYTFTQGAGRRVADVGIFNGASEAQADMRLKAINSGMNPQVARLFYNKFTVAGIRFYYNYKQYFTPRFLFTQGAGETTYGMFPGVGVVYRFELLTLILFLIFLWKHRREKVLWFIFVWIVVAPIPAGLTMGVGYAANRAAGMMPALEIASAVGLTYLLSLILRKKGRLTKLLVCLGMTVYMVFLMTGFLEFYFVRSAKVAAKGMLSGDLEAAYWLKDNTSNQLKVIVSRKFSEPQIYIAFASLWNPRNYQEQVLDWGRYKDEKLVFLDQLYEYYLGKYVFRIIKNTDLQEDKMSLLVGRPDEFPDGVNVIKKFYYPDGTPSIYVVEPFGQLYAYKNY